MREWIETSQAQNLAHEKSIKIPRVVRAESDCKGQCQKAEALTNLAKNSFQQCQEVLNAIKPEKSKMFVENATEKTETIAAIFAQLRQWIVQESNFIAKPVGESLYPFVARITDELETRIEWSISLAAHKQWKAEDFPEPNPFRVFELEKKSIETEEQLQFDLDWKHPVPFSRKGEPSKNPDESRLVTIPLPLPEGCLMKPADKLRICPICRLNAENYNDGKCDCSPDYCLSCKKLHTQCECKADNEKEPMTHKATKFDTGEFRRGLKGAQEEIRRRLEDTCTSSATPGFCPVHVVDTDEGPVIVDHDIIDD